MKLPSLRVSSLLLPLAALAAILVSASPAGAATCGTRTLSKPFPGDANSYFLAPGGSFESGSPAWALSNASVVSGNETLYLRSPEDKRSLRIAGSATSPAFCITADDPLARLVVRTARTSGGTPNYSQLNVSVTLRNAAGSVASYYLGTLLPPGHEGWYVSPRFDWGIQAGTWIFAHDGTATAQLTFTVQGGGGVWFVDDVFVDPFAGR
ncbi:MAG: hypothetical protein R3C15_15995 [Thermoleophilia bacterium]